MSRLSQFVKTVPSITSYWVLASVALVVIGVYAWSQRPDLSEMNGEYAYEESMSPESQELEKTFTTVLERMQANQHLVACVISGEVRFVDACEEYWITNKNSTGFMVSMESRYSSVLPKVGARLNLLKLVMLKLNEDPVRNDGIMNRIFRDYEDAFGSLPNMVQH
jgi:hypothetical protein